MNDVSLVLCLFLEARDLKINEKINSYIRNLVGLDGCTNLYLIRLARIWRQSRRLTSIN